MDRLKEKEAIITSGAAGLSEAHVRLFIDQGAKELAKYRIHVNSVHPGLINTPMVQESDAFEHIQAISLKRMSEPGKISQFVLFLASDDSSYSTGAEFIAYGGITA